MKDKEHNQAKSELPSAQQTLLTAEDLWKQSDDGYRYELVKGVIRRMPLAGFEHGILLSKIGSNLDKYIKKHQLGYVCSAGTGFKISQNPDTVRAPDAAFVCQAAIDEQGIPKGFWEGAPHLAVEVISPSDTDTEVDEKVDEWLIAGCEMVWVVNPRRETVEVYRSPEDITVLRGDDILDGGDVIAGFQCRVRDLFV
ncbi:MAG: Uma2 family endonuclease [Candidatus Poribacteria bacterium]|nr:Uma2 family endonuclease [Candidatus Poribacteria bacterium]